MKAIINGTTLYSGAIPLGGPISGALQMGQRETHAGGTTTSEGLWVNNIPITTNGASTNDTDWDVVHAQ
ncbi:MAG: hypothetical protein ACFCU1_13445 [Sumerlaeia bacterium]